MSQYKQWDFQVFNKRTNTYVDDSTGVCYVMNNGLSTLPTLYSDQNGTAQANPVTLSNGRITFYTAKTQTSVDLSIVTAAGSAVFAVGLSSSVHRIDVNPEQRQQLLVFPWLFNTGGTVVDTGIDLPANMLISDAFVRVLTADSGETIDLGFINAVEGGDENGLRSLVSIASTGFVQDTAVITGGSNLDYVPVTTYGVLLRTAITGSDAVASGGGSTPILYLTDGTIKSLCYTPSTSDTGRGLAYIKYDKLVGGA